MASQPLVLVSVLAAAASAIAQEPPDELAAVLRSFPDDGLCKHLEAAPTSKGAAAAKALGKLGPRAHEVAFGTLRGSHQPLPNHFLDAFTDLEATASWSVPLLVECIQYRPATAPMAMQVLRKLGNAAQPALREALAGSRMAPQALEDLNALLRTLKPPAALQRAAPVAPVDPGLATQLLDVLDGQPAQAWPALQALLRIGDEAALSAALRLCEQLQNPARAADSKRLLDALHATYRARISSDPAGPWSMPRPARDDAIRRFILANHQPHAILHWDDLLRTGRAELRRTLALAAALRSPKGSKDPFTVWVLAHPDEIPPADVRPVAIAPPPAPARPATSPAIAGAEVVKLLKQLDSGPAQQRMTAQSRLRSATVDTLPAEAVTLALAGMAQYRLHDFVQRNLAKAGTAAVKPAFDAYPKADELGKRALLHALAQIEPASETLLTFILGKARDQKTAEGRFAVQALNMMQRPDVAALAVKLLDDKEWRGDVLRRARELLPQDPKVLAARTGELLALLPGLDDEARRALLDYLTRQPREGLDLIRRWLASDGPELRLTAVGLYAARTNDPQWVATMLALLRDPDPRIVARAASGCTWAEEQRPKIAAALVELWPKASPELQTTLVRVFAQFGADAAGAKPLLEPRLQAEGWGARLPAALGLLAMEPGHPEAQAAMRALLTSAEPYTRRAALNVLQGHPALAEQFAAEVAESLDHPDTQVVLEALYVCEPAPRVAKDKRERLLQLEERVKAKDATNDDANVSDWARRVRERVEALGR